MTKAKLLLTITSLILFGSLLSSMAPTVTFANPKILALSDTCKPGTDFLNCTTNNINNATSTYGQYKGEITSSTLAEVFGKIVSIILGFVGLIFFSMMFYGGYQWFISGSSAEDRKKAGARIRNSIIGLAITMTAYGLSYYVFSRFDDLRSNEGGGNHELY